GNDRFGDTFDPDQRSPPVATPVVPDRLDRVDLVRPRVLAEAEEDHPVSVCHVLIISARADDSTEGSGSRAHEPGFPRPGWGSLNPPPSESRLPRRGALECDVLVTFWRLCVH